jgi:LPXTG-site transpeptidase (sortase) family protein
VGLTLASVFFINLIPGIRSHTSSVGLSKDTTSLHKQPGAGQTKTVLGSPVRLKIPSINVDAALDYVGLTPQGDLGVPTGPTNAAWYDRSPRPGEVGNAVIDGHFGWVNNIPAVFDDLHKLQAGDSIYIVDDRGATIAFVVRDIQMYDQNASESAVFVSNDSKAHLNLITCEGTWNEAQKSYSNRLVVFADKAT